MTEKSNVTLKENVTGTTSRSSQISEEDKRKIHGSVLYKMEPEKFDKRLLAKNNTVTLKQMQEYLDELPCALCGKKGGKCNCGSK